MRKLGSYVQRPALKSAEAHNSYDQTTLKSSFFDKALAGMSKGTEYLTHKSPSLFQKNKEHQFTPDNRDSFINATQRSMPPEHLPPISIDGSFTSAFPKNTSTHSLRSPSVDEDPLFVPIYLDEAPARSLVWLQEVSADQVSAPETLTPFPAIKTTDGIAAKRAVQKLLTLSQGTDFFSAMPSPEQLATSPSLDGSFLNALEITGSPSHASLPAQTPSLAIDLPDLETSAFPRYETWPAER